jgi:hypothetical protein
MSDTWCVVALHIVHEMLTAQIHICPIPSCNSRVGTTRTCGHGQWQLESVHYNLNMFPCRSATAQLSEMPHPCGSASFQTRRPDPRFGVPVCLSTVMRVLRRVWREVDVRQVAYYCTLQSIVHVADTRIRVRSSSSNNCVTGDLKYEACAAETTIR